MENKDIKKYQEIWEGLLFIHILLTKIYRSNKRRFLYILYSYRNLQKYIHTYTIQNIVIDIYIHNTFMNIQLYKIQNTHSYRITYIHVTDIYCYRYTYKIHVHKFTYFALKERIQYEK